MIQNDDGKNQCFDEEKFKSCSGQSLETARTYRMKSSVGKVESLFAEIC